MYQFIIIMMIIIIIIICFVDFVCSAIHSIWPKFPDQENEIVQ